MEQTEFGLTGAKSVRDRQPLPTVVQYVHPSGQTIIVEVNAARFLESIDHAIGRALLSEQPSVVLDHGLFTATRTGPQVKTKHVRGEGGKWRMVENVDTTSARNR